MANKTFIVADARFFDKDAAHECNLTIDEYNNMVIKKINENITQNDFVILLGIISKGDLIQTAQVLNAINCKKGIIDYQNQEQFSIAEWRALGMDYVWNTPGAQECQINGKNEFIVIGINKDKIFKDINKYYVATAQSILDTGKIYKDKILNISINQWNYEPIEIQERLPQIFDDQELFLRMEEKE